MNDIAFWCFFALFWNGHFGDQCIKKENANEEWKSAEETEIPSPSFQMMASITQQEGTWDITGHSYRQRSQSDVVCTCTHPLQVKAYQLWNGLWEVWNVPGKWHIPKVSHTETMKYQNKTRHPVVDHCLVTSGQAGWRVERMLGSTQIPEDACSKWHGGRHSGTRESCHWGLWKSNEGILVGKANLLQNIIGVSLARQASLLSVGCKWCAITFHLERSPAFSRWQISLEKVLPFL